MNFNPAIPGSIAMHNCVTTGILILVTHRHRLTLVLHLCASVTVSTIGNICIGKNALDEFNTLLPSYNQPTK